MTRPVIAADNYGKSAVRLVKVVRDGPVHHLFDYTVDLRCEGDFDAAHIDGDNSGVLPTDTMKNTVYALARTGTVDPPEEFAARLTARLLDAAPSVSRATVEIAAHGWHRTLVNGTPQPTSFEHGSNEARIATAIQSREAPVTFEAGIRDLVLLRSAGSAFSGYPRDQYTTLKETRDRILATSVSAHWKYDAPVPEFNHTFDSVRQAMIAAFSNHESESVQQTLYAMGEAALAACGAMSEIRLSLPNKHHILVDLSPFNLDNPNEVFVATPEPYGLIEATLRRAP